MKLLYCARCTTPLGKVLLIGVTMTVERERELFGKKVLPNEHR